jgi:signal transduction histidine kinase
VTGTALAAVTFGIGGTGAIALYDRSQTGSAARTAAQTATSIAQRVAQGGMFPDPIPGMPVGPGVPRVQVLDASGRVLSGDPVSAGQSAMLHLAPGVSRLQETLDVFGTISAVDAVRVVTPSAGRVTVVAALSLAPAAARARDAAEFIAATCLVGLLLVAAVAWLTAGWALRPVERMRVRAATIAASGDLSGRLPDPGAGELARLGGTLNDMLDSLERSVDRQRRFVADAAHELRTPLAGLTATLEVADAHPGTAGLSAPDLLTADLLAGHRRLSRLVDDLLVLAALDGRAPRRAAPVDLAGVVTDASRRRVPHGIRLTTTYTERAVVLGDESQLVRVVTNLVDNALRYADHEMELAVRAEKDFAVVTVTDDGPGIASRDREKIWERFVRLDDDRSRASGGSGLGLAMVRELVLAHGGTVSVTDRRTGPGSVFVVRVPLIPPGGSP